MPAGSRNEGHAAACQPGAGRNTNSYPGIPVEHDHDHDYDYASNGSGSGNYYRSESAAAAVEEDRSLRQSLALSWCIALHGGPGPSVAVAHPALTACAKGLVRGVTSAVRQDVLAAIEGVREVATRDSILFSLPIVGRKHPPCGTRWSQPACATQSKVQRSGLWREGGPCLHAFWKTWHLKQIGATWTAALLHDKIQKQNAAPNSHQSRVLGPNLREMWPKFNRSTVILSWNSQPRIATLRRCDHRNANS